MYPTVFWGNLLRELRENHYMLQKEVATLLHISRQSYSNIEVGKTKPTPEQLATLSYVYEVNLLDYVDKCLPASYLAERYAFRADQTRKIAEILLIQEEMEKYGTTGAKEDDSEDSPTEKELPRPRKRRKQKLEDENSRALKNELLRRRNTRKKAPQFHNTSNMSDVDLLKSKRHIEDVLARGDSGALDVSEDFPPEVQDTDPVDTTPKKERSPRKGRSAKPSPKKRQNGKPAPGKARAAGKPSKPTPRKTSARGKTSKPKSGNISASGKPRKTSSR